MNVEPITLSDIPPLVEMARRAHSESKYSHLPFSERSVAETFRSHVTSEFAFALKAVGETGVSGFFLARQSGFVFTELPVAVETSYWVTPEARGSRAFSLLMRNFTAWAEISGMPQVVMPHFAEDNEKTYSALEKLGFKDAGRIYTRGI